MGGQVINNTFKVADSCSDKKSLIEYVKDTWHRIFKFLLAVLVGKDAP